MIEIKNLYFSYTGDEPYTIKDLNLNIPGGKLVSIIVAKSNENAPEKHKVDAVSGGTITSKGLQQMLLDDLTSYQNFITRKKSAL